MLIIGRVKFYCPQNISIASQKKKATAFSYTIQVDMGFFLKL